MKIHKYTQEEKEFLREFVPGHSYKEILQAFTDKFKWDITLVQIIGSIKRYNLSTGRTGFFEKGHVPYNKGRKGICAEECKKTWFKKGHIPKNYRPIGSERVTKDGYIEVKIADPNKWKLKHRVIWEQAKGKVPHGYVIIFEDGNKLNTDIDNLMLVSRKVLAVMNKSGLYKNGYKEIAALIAELNVKVGEKKKGCKK